MKTPTPCLLRSGLLGLLLGVCGSAAQANLPDFALNGSAAIVRGTENANGGLQARYRIRLTPADFAQVGSAWLPEKVRLDRGFITGFRFQLTGLVGADAADGFAFVIQNAGLDALGGSGLGLGYDGIPRSLAIEFDTYENADFGDPNSNHVTVHTRGAEPNSVDESASIAIAANVPDLNDGKEHHVILAYFDGRLGIQLDKQDIIYVPVDLTEILDEKGAAYVGFTGATGGAFQVQDIYAWALRPF